MLRARLAHSRASVDGDRLDSEPVAPGHEHPARSGPNLGAAGASAASQPAVPDPQIASPRASSAPTQLMESNHDQTSWERALERRALPPAVASWVLRCPWAVAVQVPLHAPRGR